MKSFVLAIAVVIVSAVAVNAAEPRAAGNVSADALAQLGLGGMQPLSDEQGTQIRGQGFGISLYGTFQVNVLLVYAPSVNVQQNSIKGGNSIKVTIGGSSYRPH